MNFFSTLFSLVMGLMLAQGQVFGTVLEQSPLPSIAGGFSSPTNLPGAVADFDATPWQTYLTPVNTFTDLVGGVVATNPSETYQATNFAAGLWFGGDYVSDYFTNKPITVPAHFTVEVIFRLCQTNCFLAKTNDGQTFIPASVMDDQPRILFGNGTEGLGISNGVIFGNWGRGYHFSSANYQTTNSFRPQYDIVDANGILYTNGVVCGTGVGTPAGAFSFTGIGNSNPSYDASGYLTAIRLWNTNLTAANVASIYNWNLTNGVTEVTAGLVTEWKLNEGVGTNIYDAVGTNNGYYASGSGIPTYGGTLNLNPVWTNGFSFVNNGSNNSCIMLQSNYVIFPASSNLFNGWNRGTLTYWIKLPAPPYDLIPAETGSGLGNIILSKYDLVTQESPWDPGMWMFVEEYNGIIDNSIFICQDSSNWYETSWMFPNDGAWHFVVDEISNSIPQQYVDGIPRTQNGNSASITLNGTITNWSNPSPWSMGIGYSKWAYVNSSSYIDDVCFYTNLLTQKQIAQKLQAGPK